VGNDCRANASNARHAAARRSLADGINAGLDAGTAVLHRPPRVVDLEEQRRKVEYPLLRLGLVVCHLCGDCHECKSRRNDCYVIAGKMGPDR
jgi:hypothetical protein